MTEHNDKAKTKDMEKTAEDVVDLTLKNHPKCPRCGSKNTDQVTDHGRCLCRCDCWSHPECLDCGYRGYMNSEGDFWNVRIWKDGGVNIMQFNVLP